MRISEVLRHKGNVVTTIAPQASVQELLDTLAEHNIGAVIVSADGASIDGIVSERDVVRRLHEDGAALLGQPVLTIMTTDVHTCTLDTHIDDLMRLMTQQRIRHVPIVSDGRLAGIVSIGDVVKNRIDELEYERKHLVDYISTAQ
jgi:CBS domain-containing protein